MADSVIVLLKRTTTELRQSSAEFEILTTFLKELLNPICGAEVEVMALWAVEGPTFPKLAFRHFSRMLESDADG